MAARIIPPTGTELTTIPTRPAAPETGVLATGAAARSVRVAPPRGALRGAVALPLAMQEHTLSFLWPRECEQYARTCRAAWAVDIDAVAKRQLFALPILRYHADRAADAADGVPDRDSHRETWKTWKGFTHPDGLLYIQTGVCKGVPYTTLPVKDVVRAMSNLQAIHIDALSGNSIDEDTWGAFASKCSRFTLCGERISAATVERLARACPHMISIQLNNATNETIRILAANCHKLQSIALPSSEIGMPSTELQPLIEACPDLTLITPSAFLAIDEIFNALVTHCKNLQSLANLVSAHGHLRPQYAQVVEDKVLQLIRTCPDTTSMQLPYVSDKILAALNDCCPKLQSITLEQGTISANALIDFLQRRPLITSVTLGENCFVNEWEKADLRKTCAHVTNLDIRSRKTCALVTDLDIRSGICNHSYRHILDLVAIFPKVHSLAICDYGSPYVGEIIKEVSSQLPHLRHFTLHRGALTPFQGRDLIPLAACSSLVTLDIPEQIPMRGSTINALQGLIRSCPQLTSIRTHGRPMPRLQGTHTQTERIAIAEQHRERGTCVIS